MPQFRDADEDGLIGIRGCMRCFQDIHTWYMHSMDKGNDVLPEQYGAAWIYTRYQIRLHRKMDYSGPMTLSTWIEPGRQQARVTLNVTIRQGGDLTAEGRLESCIYSLTQRRPLRLSAVEFPENLAEDLPHEIPAFRKLGKDTDRMEQRYQKTVRVSDLDKSRHMTNLRYIEMFQDAYDSAFWNRFQPRKMEICFLSQCMEGEILNVKSRQEENALYLAAQHEDGTVAAVAVFTGDQA
jgi:acyl-ACP thioesterase